MYLNGYSARQILIEMLMEVLVHLMTLLLDAKDNFEMGLKSFTEDPRCERSQWKNWRLYNLLDRRVNIQSDHECKLWQSVENYSQRTAQVKVLDTLCSYSSSQCAVEESKQWNFVTSLQATFSYTQSRTNPCRVGLTPQIRWNNSFQPNL